MHVRGQSNVLAWLGGPAGGLLPAVFALPPLWWALPPDGAVFLWLSLVMAACDLASRRIPNFLTAITALCGLTWSLAAHGVAGLGWSLLAGGMIFCSMAVFFFLGAVGAGDVKALGSLATFLSPWGSLQFLLATLLCGGVLALLRLVLARRGLVLAGGPAAWRLDAGRLELPYGVAVALGAAWARLMGVA